LFTIAPRAAKNEQPPNVAKFINIDLIHASNIRLESLLIGMLASIHG
jgi:hypothetical protein